MLLSPLIPSEKSLRIGKLLSLQWQRQVFQSSDFHLIAQILLLAKNILSCFPWSDRFTRFIFKEISSKYPSLNNQVACKPFFQVKMAFHAKSSYFNSYPNYTETAVFFTMKHKCFKHISHFITQNIKKAWIAGLGYNKLTILTAPSRIFLNKTCFFSSPFESHSKRHNDSWCYPWGNYLDVHWGPAVLPTMAPVPLVHMSLQWKGQIMPQYSHKNCFDLVYSLRGP